MYITTGILCIGLNQRIHSQATGVDTVWFSLNNDFSKNGGEGCYYLANQHETKANLPEKKVKKQEWAIHGDINYDYTFRSLTNNPLQETNIHRHTVRLNFNVQGPVPFQGSLAISAGNSVYYPRLFNLSLNYNRQQWLNNLKNQYVKHLVNSLPGEKGLPFLADSMKGIENTIYQYQQIVQSPDYQFKVQKGKEIILNEALKMLNQRLNVRDSLELKKDIENYLTSGINKPATVKDIKPVQNEILNWVKQSLIQLKQDRNILDSMVAKRKAMANKYKGLQQSINDTVRMVNQAFNQMTNSSELAGQYMDSAQHKIAKVLNKFERINIGRSEVNYSRLSVFNWPITGINIATSSKHTFELAVGMANYRQRNFLLSEQNGRIPSQPTLAGRYLMIVKPQYTISYTAYWGSMLLNYQGVSQPKQIPVYGNGLQLNVYPIKNQKIEFEFVKSNVNELRSLPGTGIKTSGELFNFGIRENEAIRFQYTGAFPAIKARADGEYTKSGSNFLSLGLYPGEAKRETYRANFQKHFWDKKLDVKLGLRKNSFTYPYIQQLTANNILYQGLVTFRMAKLPVITVGYFPSSQLVAMPDSNLAEMNLQTIIASASYQLVKPKLTHLFLLTGSMLKTKVVDAAATAGVLNNFMSIQYFGMGKKWKVESMMLYNRLKLQSLVTYGLGGGLKQGKGWEEAVLIKYHVNNVGSSQVGYRILLRSKQFSFGQLMLEGERQMLPYYSASKFVPVISGHAVLVVKF
jgi:hypothetical protein